MYVNCKGVSVISDYRPNQVRHFCFGSWGFPTSNFRTGPLHILNTKGTVIIELGENYEYEQLISCNLSPIFNIYFLDNCKRLSVILTNFGYGTVHESYIINQTYIINLYMYIYFSYFLLPFTS